jgi:hypothetical protein
VAQIPAIGMGEQGGFVKRILGIGGFCAAKINHWAFGQVFKG